MFDWPNFLFQSVSTPCAEGLVEVGCWWAKYAPVYRSILMYSSGGGGGPVQFFSTCEKITQFLRFCKYIGFCNIPIF
jgi:hypothetical protein